MRILAAIAAAAVATTACKKTPKPAHDEDASTTSAASATPQAPTDWTLGEMKTVNATSPVGGIAVYAEVLDNEGKSRALEQVATYGQPCSQVNADPTTCQQMVRLVSEQAKAKRTVVALVRRTDRFEVITEEKALRSLLGDIDTPMEARLLASFAAASKIWSPQCTGFTRTIVMEAASPSGYALKLEKRVRKGTLKNPDGSVACSDCIIVEQRNATVRRNGVVELGPTQESEWVRPMGCGRSPGWACSASVPVGARTEGGYLAHAAHLEAASVAAFERIAEELVALGAPGELVLRARRAAIEERAHARIVAELAHAYGSEPVPFTMRAYRLRDAFELALDNATEGCVNETFGALVLHVQALTAEDLVARRAFADIAEDESRHAELSRDVADWLDGRLSPGEREAVRRASDDARYALLASLDVEPELRRLGLPSPATRRALYAGLARSTS